MKYNFDVYETGKNTFAFHCDLLNTTTDDFDNRHDALHYLCDERGKRIKELSKKCNGDCNCPNDADVGYCTEHDEYYGKEILALHDRIGVLTKRTLELEKEIGTE